MLWDDLKDKLRKNALESIVGAETAALHCPDHRG